MLCEFFCNWHTTLQNPKLLQKIVKYLKMKIRKENQTICKWKSDTFVSTPKNIKCYHFLWAWTQLLCNHRWDYIIETFCLQCLFKSHANTNELIVRLHDRDIFVPKVYFCPQSIFLSSKYVFVLKVYFCHMQTSMKWFWDCIMETFLSSKYLLVTCNNNELITLE